jgi:hypothetical protein
MGGVASTGTLTLSGPAPAGGTIVDLSPAARLNLTDAQGNPITSVVVPQGATTASFLAVPEGSLARTPLPVTATLRVGGATSTGNVIVSASVLSSVGLSPSTITGGGGVSGTITLIGPAPREGAVVNLSSSPAIVSFRNMASQAVSSLVVPAGSASVLFTVVTSPLGTGEVQTVTIGAVIAGQSSASAPLTVRGPAKSATKDNKDGKDSKDSGDSGGGGGGGKIIHENIAPFFPSFGAPDLTQAEDASPTGRAFIEPAERPDVGQAILDAAEPSATSAEGTSTEGGSGGARRRRKSSG